MLGCMSFSSAERRRLAELFHQLGPDAPTLCEGWDARDLAVHLYIREHRPLAAAGNFLPFLRGRLEDVESQVSGADFKNVVDKWAAGPGRLHPMRVLDTAANTAEHFVHHEDLRRGGGEIVPRDFSQVVNSQLHQTVNKMAGMFLRGNDIPVVLAAKGFQPVIAPAGRGVAEQGDNVVRISGDPGELLLWLFGRDAVEVSIEGPVDAIRRSGI